MTRIFLHPFSGVLSAYGMGLADIRAVREQQVSTPFLSQHLTDFETQLSVLREAAVQELVDQGLSLTEIEIDVQALLRYDGSDTTLPITWDHLDDMAATFETHHHQRFGFSAPGKPLVLEALVVEAIGGTEEGIDPVHALSTTEVPPFDALHPVYMTGSWLGVPIYDRAKVLPGQTVSGPAIISETTGTIVIEPGWQGRVTAQDHMILDRVEPLARAEAIGTTADPVMLEVFNNLFMSIAEQMGSTLANTAHSVNIKERLDFSCAIFDSVGQLVANAPHVPVHLGPMGETVKTLLAAQGDALAPGDVFAVNNPYNGGTHLPDVTVITPVFGEAGDVMFFVASRGHHADIGGRTPGSSPPDSRVIEEEGVLLDNFLLVEKGRMRDAETRAVLTSGRYPVRNVDQNMQDLAAQIAANQTGVAEVQKMVAHFGWDVVQAYMTHVQDNAEEAVRRVLGALRDGQFVYPMDTGSQIQVSIKVNAADRTAVIDFTGTSPQSDTNYNAPFAVCKAAVLYVFRTLVDDMIPLNEGCLKPLTIIAPEGTFIRPQYPAAVIAGNTEVSQALTDALYGAMGVLASSQGTMNNFVYGNDQYQNYETICGGTGAGADHPGTSAVHSHMTNTRMTDTEILEQRFPVRVERFAIRKGSGGAGRNPGGDGVIRHMTVLEPMTATLLTSHRLTDPYGLDGGGPGKRGHNRVQRADGSLEDVGPNAEVTLNAGDAMIIETPGGGGYGV